MTCVPINISCCCHMSEHETLGIDSLPAFLLTRYVCIARGFAVPVFLPN